MIFRYRRPHTSRDADGRCRDVETLWRAVFRGCRHLVGKAYPETRVAGRRRVVRYYLVDAAGKCQGRTYVTVLHPGAPGGVSPKVGVRVYARAEWLLPRLQAWAAEVGPHPDAVSFSAFGEGEEEALARKAEVDWRPQELLPEDYYVA